MQFTKLNISNGKIRVQRSPKNRIWTANRLKIHGWPNNYFCTLWMEPGDGFKSFLTMPGSQSYTGLATICSYLQAGTPSPPWTWRTDICSLHTAPAAVRQKERDPSPCSRCGPFRKSKPVWSVMEIISKIQDEAQSWSIARAKHLAMMLPPPYPFFFCLFGVFFLFAPCFYCSYAY